MLAWELRQMKEEHPYLSDVQKIIHENIKEYWKIKGLEYNQPQIWNSKECVRNWFAAIQELLEASPVCNTPCKISSCICELMCIQRRDGVPSEFLSFSDFCGVTFPEEWHFISRQHSRRRGELPAAGPVLPQAPNLSAELSSALLSSAPLCPSHPGTATGSCPLEFGIPAHPCVYWELSTQITPLLFIWFYGIGLEVSSLGRSKSDLSSPGIPSWACSGIWIVTLH